MRKIPLTRGYETMVDDADYEFLMQWKWCAYTDKKNVYVTRTCREGPKQKQVRMHRLIMGAPKGLQVDHINGNGLDNRRENLRLVTNQQNCMNSRSHRGTSKYKGVSFETARGKWLAKIGYNWECYTLGIFDEEEDAAIAYNVAAQLFYGDYAYLNDV